MINNLTFDARSIQGDAADVKIVISLAGTDYLRPEFIAGARGAIVQNLPLELVTGADGTVVTPLVATTDYVNATQYVARIGNGKPITFTMPDNDANFYEITQQAGVPPSPASLPVGLQDGDVIVGQDGEYALKKQIWVHPNPPTNPATNAIWWDSSTTPAEPRYTSDAGMSWQAILSAEDLAARINSLTGGSRVQGEHIEGLPDIPIVADAPTSTEGYRPSNLLLVQPTGVTDRMTLYGVSGEVDAAVTNRNRLQFVIANNAIQSNPAPTDNYRNFLGSINYNQGTRSSVLTIRLDTGLFGAEIPDQLWITGLESSGAAEFRADIARPTIRSNGRTYKQLNYVVSDALRASGINGAQTWLLFSDVGATQAFDFKPAIEHNPSEWVPLSGGTGGGGLSQGQVDNRVRALVEDWAEEGNTDAIPAGKLTNAPGGISQADATNLIAAWARASGASGQAPSSVLASDTPSQHQVLIATSATGREWDLIDGSNIANAGIEADNIPDGEITGAKMAQDTIQQSNLHPNLERQLIPGGGNQGQVLKKSSNNPYETNWANDEGLTQTQVDGRVDALVEEFAEVANTTTAVPTSKGGLPTGGDTNQILSKSSSSNYATQWVDAPSGGTGGLNQSQVDARIAQFARAGNTDLIPRAKLASGGSTGQVLKRTATGQEWANDEGLTQTQVDARVQAGVADWAETGNNDEVPVAKVASGGLTGQALVRTATGKRWQTISTGAGTPLSVTAVESDFSPALASTDFSGLTEHQINITAGTLDSNHPFSVSSNGIVVASNTNPFLAELGVRFDIDPTAWTNSANAGGNRMFLQAYWKKDGTIIESTRRDYYIRGDERYAPTTHILPYNTTEILSPGTYTLWLIKVGLAAAGNEINSISLASTSSINIRSEEYSGGNVEAGLNEAAVDARVSAGVLDWAETGDTDTIPSTKLASGGSVGQVLKRTATGQEWGADAGGLSQAQVDARVAERVPDGGATGQVLKKTSASDGDTEWANDVGLTQSQVDARVQAGVANFAEEGNTDLVPQGKLASGGSVGQVLKRTASGQEWANDNEGLNQSQVDARVTAGVADFAEQGNTDLIPQGKLASGGSTGQVLKRTSSSQEWANDEGLTQTQVDGRVTALVEDFAEVANASTAVPTSKGGVPSGGADNQVLTKTSGSDYAMAWETPASGGLNQAAVDARIAAFARAGNTDLVPQAKLASGGSVGDVLKRTASGQEWSGDIGLNQTEVDGRVTALVANFAEEGNAALLPDGKLSTTTRNRLMPSGGADNQVLTKTSGSDYAVAWETPASPGLNQAAVDARVQAGVKDYAEQGNTTNKIPLDDLATAVSQRLLPSGGADEQILAKSAAGDYQVEWVDAPSGGGSTATNIPGVEEVVAYRTYADAGSSGNSVVLPSDYTNADFLYVTTAFRDALGGNFANREFYEIPISSLMSAISGNIVWEGRNSGFTQFSFNSTTRTLSISNTETLAYRFTYVALKTIGGRTSDLRVTPLLSTVTPSLADTASTFTTEGNTLQLALTAGTLNSRHPFSVSSNQLVVAAGTNPFLATIETELEIDPTAWTTSGPGRGPASGGNRLFFDSYINKDGTELTGSRQSHYIRGDEDWAPLVHTIKSSFTYAFTPGNYTWHIERTKTAGGGNEINAIQIANSHIEINSQDFAGAVAPAVASRTHKNVIVALRDYNSSPSSNTKTSASVSLPSNYSSYDELIVVAGDGQQRSLEGDETEFRIITDRLTTTNNIFLQTNLYDGGSTKYMTLRNIASSGVVTIDIDANPSTTRPRILYVALISYAGVE